MNAMNLLLTLASTCTLTVSATVPIPESCKTGGFAVGCQAWTWNRYTVFEAIEKTAACGGKVIELFPGQKFAVEGPAKFDHNSSDEDVAKVKAQLEKSGVRAVNYGVVGIPQDEAGARKVFDFARKLGLRAITTESVDAIETIEKLVKEYDICVGFHNHPSNPKDANYKVWDPNFILSVVKERDSRIGAAADTGHWERSGLNAVECLRILKGRIISTHLKDLNEFGKREAHNVPFGTGISPVKEILDELKAQGFAGNISIEHEYNWESSMPEVAQCVGFIRGYGAVK
jgi:sugar phosphate isomerase/epimerase